MVFFFFVEAYTESNDEILTVCLYFFTLCSREYLSEYKKRFRPFSQYEYVDGKFFKKKGDQEIGSPWFHEVIELRKKAGEYRVRRTQLLA